MNSTGWANWTRCWAAALREGYSMSVFKAAAVQMRSGTSVERNAATMDEMVREAAAQGAH